MNRIYTDDQIEEACVSEKPTYDLKNYVREEENVFM